MAAGAWIFTNTGRTSLLDGTDADVTVTTGNTLTVAAHASGIFTLS